MGGVPVSDYAKKRSVLWARGELTGEQMKEALLASHQRMAEQMRDKKCLGEDPDLR